MPNLKCGTCGGGVTRDAEYCPHCNAQLISTGEFIKRNSKQAIKESLNELDNIGGWIVIILLGIIAVAIFK
jgi:endogenous inhibitor of DNA gyrase (YacG/DUF329 family)